MNENQYLDTPIDMVSSFDDIEVAPTWKRFVNFVVDTISYYVVIFIVVFLIAYSDSDILIDNETSEITFVYYIIFFGSFILYYSIFEGLLGGRTMGKIISGTRVIYYGGDLISFKTAFLRSVSRLVPFEPFSCFGGSGWHDQWTDTMVVNESDYRKSRGN